MEEKIKLGDMVEDTVSGFTGIVTSTVNYLNGCFQYGVTPRVGKDGKMPEVQYIDAAQVKRRGPGVNYNPGDETAEAPSGFRADAPKK